MTHVGDSGAALVAAVRAIAVIRDRAEQIDVNFLRSANEALRLLPCEELEEGERDHFGKASAQRCDLGACLAETRLDQAPPILVAILQRHFDAPSPGDKLHFSHVCQRRFEAEDARNNGAEEPRVTGRNFRSAADDIEHLRRRAIHFVDVDRSSRNVDELTPERRRECERHVPLRSNCEAEETAEEAQHVLVAPPLRRGVQRPALAVDPRVEPMIIRWDEEREQARGEVVRATVLELGAHLRNADSIEPNAFASFADEFRFPRVLISSECRRRRAPEVAKSLLEHCRVATFLPTSVAIAIEHLRCGARSDAIEE